MELATESIFNDKVNRIKGSRMCCLLESNKNSSPTRAIQIELARSIISKICGNDAVNLLTEWLDSD
jgi:hypothetical protein